jgi:hypothetical protein
VEARGTKRTERMPAPPIKKLKNHSKGKRGREKYKAKQRPKTDFLREVSQGEKKRLRSRVEIA